MTVAIGIGLMEFPFRSADNFWRWVDVCEASPLDSIWQVRITSDIAASFDTVALRNIEVVPATDLAGGNLVTGEADISLGQQLDTTLRLSAANLDIDHLLGRNLLRSGNDGSTAAVLDAVSSVLEVLPADTSIRFDTAITSLIVGGETLTRVSLAGQLSPGSLRISEASAGLPGQAGWNGGHSTSEGPSRCSRRSVPQWPSSR